MPKTFKRNAIIVFAMAVFFYWSFMFAKHDPALRDVIPFGEDPYDAIGSYGVIAGGLIAIVSLVRAFRPYRCGSPTTSQCVYLIRSQESVVLAVLITVAADIVALARHPLVWIGPASRSKLITLLACLTFAAVAVHLLIRASQRTLPETGSTSAGPAVIATLLAMLVLVLYPEKLIGRIISHLLTVVFGAFALFVPMRFLLAFLVPYRNHEGTSETPAQSGFSTIRRHRWTITVLIGIMVGILTFLGEMSEGASALPASRVVFVACVFISLGLAGLLVAYAFLGKPLGLGRQA